MCGGSQHCNISWDLSKTFSEFENSQEVNARKQNTIFKKRVMTTSAGTLRISSRTLVTSGCCMTWQPKKKHQQQAVWERYLLMVFNQSRFSTQNNYYEAWPVSGFPVPSQEDGSLRNPKKQAVSSFTAKTFDSKLFKNGWTSFPRKKHSLKKMLIGKQQCSKKATWAAWWINCDEQWWTSWECACKLDHCSRPGVNCFGRLCVCVCNDCRKTAMLFCAVNQTSNSTKPASLFFIWPLLLLRAKPVKKDLLRPHVLLHPPSFPLTMRPWLEHLRQSQEGTGLNRECSEKTSVDEKLLHTYTLLREIQQTCDLTWPDMTFYTKRNDT